MIKSIDPLFSKSFKITLDGCWNWLLACRGNYGLVKRKGKMLKAHRYSYELFVGPIKDGLLVLHKCDNPKCVNPKHLFLGTNADNMKDRDNKKRHSHGVRHPKARLTEEQVLRIIHWNKSTGVMLKDIALELGVSMVTIEKIRGGYNWKHLQPKKAAK
jgi:HNH endonuclease